jgi:predicted HicB family RNase H-like nuclease
VQAINLHFYVPLEVRSEIETQAARDRLTVSAWCRNAISAVLGKSADLPQRTPPMEPQLYARLPVYIREKFVAQAEDEGISRGLWLRQALEKALAMPVGSAAVGFERLEDEGVKWFSPVYVRVSTELRRKVLERAKLEGMTQSYWVRWAIEENMKVYHQAMMDLEVESCDCSLELSLETES